MLPNVARRTKTKIIVLGLFTFLCAQNLQGNDPDTKCSQPQEPLLAVPPIDKVMKALQPPKCKIYTTDPKLSEPIEGGNLSPFWAQDRVGADLAVSFVKAQG